MGTPPSNTAPLFLPSGVNNVLPQDTVRMPNVKRAELGANGHWQFEEQMYTAGYIGFVYGIRHKVTGRLYIGKKLYAGMGVQNKGVESNWKYYCSSNKVIDADVRTLRNAGFEASEVFDFYCLEQYATKGGLSFAEVWSLVIAEVPSNRKLFYNSLINGISWPVREPVSLRHKERLAQFIGLSSRNYP